MKLPTKNLEQIAFNTRPKKEEHMLFVMEKSIQEEARSQPLQSNKRQFKLAVTFLTGYYGIFNVTNKINNFFSRYHLMMIFFRVISIPLRAHELKSLNNDFKCIIIEEGYLTESNYPFLIKPNFSTLVSIIETSSNITGSQIAFTPNDSIGYLLELKPRVLHEELN